MIAGAIAAVVAALIIFKDESITIGDTTATLGEWMQATWEVTKDRLIALWENLKEAWAVVRDFLVNSWGIIKDTIAGSVQQIVSILASFVGTAGEILGGLGRILGVVFGALVNAIKTGINFMIAAIASVPLAVGAAVDAIQEGDFDGIFQRIRKATAGNFDKDYIGDLVGGVTQGISDLATMVADVTRFTFEGARDDVVRFLQDIQAKAKEFAANRPAGGGGGFPAPRGDRNRPGAGGVDVGAQIQAALDEAATNAASVQQAFDLLQQSPIEEVAQRYKVFQEAAHQATEKINQQKEALKKLGLETPGVAAALKALDDKLKAIADQSTAAQLFVIAKGFESIEAATARAESALSALDESPLSEVLERTEDVDRAMAELDKTIAEQQQLLAGLSKESKEYAQIEEELLQKIAKRTELEAERANVVAEVSEGTRDALKALKEYASSESTAFKAQKLAEYLAAIEKVKTEINNAKTLLGQLKPDSDAFRETEAHIKSLEGHLGEVQRIAAGKGIELAVPGEDGLKEYADIWNKFVDDAMASFSDLFLNVLEGNVDSFDDFVGSIKKLFKKMLADMAAAAIKNVINIPVAVGGDETGKGGLTAVAGGTGSFNLDVFKTGGNFDWGKILGTAAMGLSVGSIVGSFVAEDDSYAELGAQILGVVGAVVGAVLMYWAPQVGALIGSVIGSAIGAILGGLIKKGLPKTSATLQVEDGRAVVDEFYTRNKGSLDQIRQYAEEVVKGINELAALTGGILLDLPNVKLSIKNNKFFQVVDASGITHKFGEDYEAAINFAVLQALKGAEFSGLSPEVEAAIRNSKATTIEELASDIEFGKEVQDIDLEPVTKDLRDVIRRFTEMSARAKELGISLDKVDKAFSKAVNAIKDDILSGLKPFQEAGLTDVEREANRITEAFEEMRENARLFNEELARAREARGQEITGLQEELARQQGLLAQAQQNPEDFLPPELLERLVGRGVDPEVLTRMATAGIQEVIDKLMAEILRLQGLDAEQTPIDMSEIDRAEQAARRALRDRVRDALDPYLRANLTPVQQQLLQLNDTFEKLRRDAQAAGVSMGEVNRAYEEAIKALRKQVMDQLQPYLDMADDLTPLQVQLRELDERFAELRTNARELGIDMETVNRAEQAAREQLRQQFEDELAAFGGENPFVAQLDELQKKFEELKKNAEALGISTDRVNEAYQQALEIMQKQFQEGIQSYLDYGRGLSDVAVRHRDLTKFFEEQREAARALDEALGFTGGGGPNERLLGEAEAAAFQQLVDDFKASLQDLRDAGLTPTEIAVRDMRDRFAQLREDAQLLGLSVDELTRLEVAAIERLRGELDAQLDRYLLSDEEQQQRSMEQEFLTYLRDALALYTYEPGGQDPLEPEAVPGRPPARTDVRRRQDRVRRAGAHLPRPAPRRGRHHPTAADHARRCSHRSHSRRAGRLGARPARAPVRGARHGGPAGGTALRDRRRVHPGGAAARAAPPGHDRRRRRPPGRARQPGVAAPAVGLRDRRLAPGAHRGPGLGRHRGLPRRAARRRPGLDRRLRRADRHPALRRRPVAARPDAPARQWHVRRHPGDARPDRDPARARRGAQEDRPGLRGRPEPAAPRPDGRARRGRRRLPGSRAAPARARRPAAPARTVRGPAALAGRARAQEAQRAVRRDARERRPPRGLARPGRGGLPDRDRGLLGAPARAAQQLPPEPVTLRAFDAHAPAAARRGPGPLPGPRRPRPRRRPRSRPAAPGRGPAIPSGGPVLLCQRRGVPGHLRPGQQHHPAGARQPGSGPAARAGPGRELLRAHLLAQTGWSWQDRMATAGLPFPTFAGDRLLHGYEPDEGPAWLGAPAEGGTVLSSDLSGMREGNRVLIEEVRLSRQQEHVDAVELQRRVDQQSEELKEVRALLRRLTSTTQYGGRVQ